MDEIFEGFASPLDLVEYLVCGAGAEAITGRTPSGRAPGVFTLRGLDLRKLEI